MIAIKTKEEIKIPISALVRNLTEKSNKKLILDIAEEENTFFLVFNKKIGETEDTQLTVGIIDGQNIIFFKSVGDKGLAYAKISQKKAIQRILKASLETLGEKRFLNLLTEKEIITDDVVSLYKSPYVKSNTLSKAFENLPFSRKLYQLDFDVTIKPA